MYTGQPEKPANFFLAASLQLLLSFNCKTMFYYVRYLQSSISCFRLSTCLFNSLFSSLQCTLMHFVGGNEDLGVFIPTCRRTSWDGSCGNGCGVLTSVSDSPLLDETMLSAESLVTIRGAVIVATS